MAPPASQASLHVPSCSCTFAWGALTTPLCPFPRVDGAFLLRSLLGTWFPAHSLFAASFSDGRDDVAATGAASVHPAWTALGPLQGPAVLKALIPPDGHSLYFLEGSACVSLPRFPWRVCRKHGRNASWWEHGTEPSQQTFPIS